MDGPRGYYTKWNKSDRVTNARWFHLYVKSEKQNECTGRTETDIIIENIYTVARWEGVFWGWIKKYKLD